MMEGSSDTSRTTRPETVLEEADSLIHGARREEYGGVKESFTMIAALWSPILGVTVTPAQVALCMVQLKLARFLHGHARDSVVDMAGYTGLLEQLVELTVTQ